MNTWNVYEQGTDDDVDTVFYDPNCDAEYVYTSLVNHDGYNPNIYVELQGDSDNRYPPEH